MPVKKAGAIILGARDPKEVLLLFRSKHNDWSFPKGHIEAGESGLDAVAREAKEETGLEIVVLKALSSMEYRNDKEGQVSCEMFLARSKDDDALIFENEGDRLLWVGYQEVTQRLSYQNLREWYEKNFNEI
jgi:8-oxo-dGTP pyrophosphatase MutT (NUDIX family)